MRAPRVSVITIFLDEERFLAEAIASVRAQTFGDWELLLVDDGSRDQSAAIARASVAADPKRIRYLQHPGGVNRGMSADAALDSLRGASEDAREKRVANKNIETFFVAKLSSIFFSCLSQELDAGVETFPID